jgi:hypothetical protein
LPHEQDIAHLHAVAEERDGFVLKGTDQEMGDPSLILCAELMGPIDTAHAEHDGWQPIYAGIIDDVLIGGTF